MARISRKTSPAAVAELQGLYGPFTFPEKLLQKIWLRGAFERRDAVVADGRRIAILHPGKWNLLGGPDFLGARLAFGDGPAVTGDVELHLHAEDWQAHAHAADSAYDSVILHVVLFPPARDRVTRGAGGREIPVLTLLPLLDHDLEEYAAEEALETLTNRPGSQVVEVLGRLPPAELLALLRRHTQARWEQKIHFAGRRVAKLGWESACHHAALEVLGYRFNRSPMLRVASAHALAVWPAEAAAADAIFSAERGAGGWGVQGVRPANHPRTRLRQYSAWVRARRRWPADLLKLGGELASLNHGEASGVAAIRRVAGFVRARREFAGLTGGAISGPRLDTLICDALLPLLAARGGPEGATALAWWWENWYPGDLPPRCLRALRDLGVVGRGADPASHGAAQGLLGWLLGQERLAGGAAGPGA